MNRETNLTQDEDKKFVRKIQSKTFNNDPKIPLHNEENLKKLEEIFSTAFFHAPLIKDAESLAEKRSKVYEFVFSYQGSMTIADIFRFNIASVNKPTLGQLLLGLLSGWAYYPGGFYVMLLKTMS